MVSWETVQSLIFVYTDLQINECPQQNTFTSTPLIIFISSPNIVTLNFHTFFLISYFLSHLLTSSVNVNVIHNLIVLKAPTMINKMNILCSTSKDYNPL